MVLFNQNEKLLKEVEVKGRKIEQRDLERRPPWKVYRRERNDTGKIN